MGSVGPWIVGSQHLHQKAGPAWEELLGRGPEGGGAGGQTQQRVSCFLHVCKQGDVTRSLMSPVLEEPSFDTRKILQGKWRARERGGSSVD